MTKIYRNSKVSRAAGEHTSTAIKLTSETPAMAPAANCHWKPRGLSEDILLALLVEVFNWRIPDSQLKSGGGMATGFIILVKPALRPRTTGESKIWETHQSGVY